MNLVQKYGGSSVADVEKIRKVAAKVKARREAGARMVVVVSAMGDTTDELLALAKQVSADPPRRELDMLLTCGERISMALLSMALQELAVPAISFTGSQSGIITDLAHSQARIIEVRPRRIEEELERGKVVIVAGYQGVSLAKEVTTLGRGGSDTTAVALAAALGADCEIYSDVDGVFSADPRVVPDARKLDSLSYDEMQELAVSGAKVLNAVAVEFAKSKEILIHAKSAHGAGTGTTVGAEAPRNSPRVRGVSSDASQLVLSARNEALPALLGFFDEKGLKGRLISFEALAGHESRTLVALPLDDVHGLEALEKELSGRFGARVQLHRGLGTVSCVGAGITSDWALVRRALELANGLGIQVQGVYSSPLQFSLILPAEQLKPLTRALHAEFLPTSEGAG